MSSNELLPLFPSATHPALPISAQILSTLRNLTAPGRGNDLKPEERAALVGVAALIGCERIQSKDLHESSAQKASSVSPAHFRSALVKSRKILSQSRETPFTSPSKRSSRSSTSTTSPSKNVVSPFETPKKQFKFTSGVDLSGLVRTPRGLGSGVGVGSPLKFSVTPSKGTGKGKEREVEEEEAGLDVEMEGEGEVEMKTPTKRVKYALRDGVDLEKEVEGMGQVVVGASVKRSGWRNVGAFFALRPGASGAGGGGDVRFGRDADGPTGWGVDRGEEERRPKRAKRVVSTRKKADKPRRDWTYRETKWSSVGDRNVLQQIFTALPVWMDAHGIVPSREEPKLSVDDTLLAKFESATDRLEAVEANSE